jgi:hypothetical protein
MASSTPQLIARSPDRLVSRDSRHLALGRHKPVKLLLVISGAHGPLQTKTCSAVTLLSLPNRSAAFFAPDPTDTAARDLIHSPLTN